MCAVKLADIVRCVTTAHVYAVRAYVLTATNDRNLPKFRAQKAATNVIHRGRREALQRLTPMSALGRRSPHLSAAAMSAMQIRMPEPDFPPSSPILSSKLIAIQTASG